VTRLRPWSTLAGRLAVTTVVVGLLAGVPGAIAFRQSARSSTQRDVSIRNAAFATRLAREVDTRVEGLVEELRLVAAFRTVAALSGSPTDLAVGVRIIDRVNALVLFDAEGRPRAASAADRLLSPDEIDARPDLVEDVADRGSVVDVVDGSAPEVRVAVPVEQPPGTLVGVLLATTALDHVTFGLRVPEVGASTVAYVVDGSGLVIAHPEQNRVVNRERFPLGEVLGRRPPADTIPRSGGSVLAAAARTRLFPGAVVVEQDTDAALAPAAERQRELTLLLLAVLAVVVVAVSVLGSRMLRPLRGLARVVSRLGKGDRAARVPVEGTSELRAVSVEVNRMADALDERLAHLEAAQRELAWAEERFRTAFREAPVGMAITDLDGRYVDVNPALCDLLQRSEDALIGSGWQDLAHPGDLESSATPTEEALRSGMQRYQLEKRYVRPDGSDVWVLLNVAVLRDPDGRPDRYLAHVMDMTAQRRSQEDLARLFVQATGAEERIRRVLDAAPDATIVADETGRITYVNQRVGRTFGYEPEEVLGNDVEFLIPQRFHESHLRHRAGFMGAPRAREMGAGLELWGVRKDGAEFPIEVSLAPLTTDEGIQVIASVRDVSERRNAEAAALALLEARARQRQAMEVNDSILQGLTVARWSLELGDLDRSIDAMERTLSSARALISEMLADATPEGLRPGDLVRERPAELS
jgi:PAS domain S-box-containing protein